MKAPLTVSLLIFLTAFTVVSAASVVQPDDGPYYRLRRGRILYVYDPIAKENIAQIAGYMEAVRALYDQSFNWRLDEEQDLVLTSPRQQIANAYATVSPDIASVWYPSGGPFLEESAESSWFLTLATHETAHLYQLNSKGPVNSFLKKIFGNMSYAYLFRVPAIFIHPNQLTPTFLIEGNAVMNESRANMGGRLHSGEYRALVLAQIKAGEITPNRLINNEFRFPFGLTPYAQGAYFQAHLAAKHGVDKTNSFFLDQGDHWLWPFILNSTFREHFGASYPQEIHEYVREMQGLADKQRVSEGRVLAESLYFSPLNHDDKRIFFLESGGIYPSTLHVLGKQGVGGYSEPHDLPLGKIFFDGETPLAAASEQHDLHHVEYSLYGEGQRFDPRYAGQVVSDQRAGKTVALDAGNAWLETHVLVNGENYDVGHSLPILDRGGNVYYFRQNGSERILFKNRLPIFKYDGFYGKLMEVGTDGGIYFIANTDYGSTLYEYKDKEIFRVLPSDVVVDARQLNDTQFLAVEVGPSGHRAVLTPAERKPATPAVYSYGFPSYNLQPAKIEAAEQIKQDERSYSSLLEQRYSSTQITSGYNSSDGLYGSLNALFVDPLQYQTFNLGVLGGTNATQGFVGGYSFTKYLPTLSFRYVYEKEIWQQSNSATRHSYNQQVLGGWTLPLLRWRHWDASWSMMGEYHLDDGHVDPSALPTTPKIQTQETYGAFNTLNLEFLENPEPALGLYPWQMFTLNYQNKLESLPGAWKKKYNTSMVQGQYTHGFPLQFYASLSGDVAWGENHDINIYYDPTALVQDIHIPRLVAHDFYTVKTASAARLELSKVFNTPAYSPRIPFSVERVAPLLVAQGMFFDRDSRGFGDYPPSIFEWGWGADIQVLLAHIGAMKLRVLSAYDTAHPVHAGDKQVTLTGKFSF